ncbi:MAG: hypothetical protein ABR583_01005 [Gaiellaceae bacterium]
MQRRAFTEPVGAGTGRRRGTLRAARGGALLAMALAAGGCLGEEREDAESAAPASAAFAPRLRVEQQPSLPGRPTTLTIDVTQQRGEPALKSAEILVPDGFRVEPPPSGSMGELDAALETGTADTVFTGRLALSGDDGEACGSGRATKLAALLAPGGAATSRVKLALSVSPAGASTRLTICPPAPDALPHEAAIRRLTIRLERGLTPPNVGDAVWRGVFTPEDGMATESRAIVPTPSFLTLEAGRSSIAPGATIRLQGYLLQREPQQRRKVRILAGPAPDQLELVGRARTRANGSYTFTLQAPRRAGTLYVAARALSVEQACKGESDAPAGCTTATVSGITSHPLRIAVVRQ